jgi:hypothetical protein
MNAPASSPARIGEPAKARRYGPVQGRYEVGRCRTSSRAYRRFPGLAAPPAIPVLLRDRRPGKAQPERELVRARCNPRAASHAMKALGINSGSHLAGGVMQARAPGGASDTTNKVFSLTKTPQKCHIRLEFNDKEKIRADFMAFRRSIIDSMAELLQNGRKDPPRTASATSGSRKIEPRAAQPALMPAAAPSARSRVA